MNRQILSLTFAAWIIAVPGIVLAQTAHTHQQGTVPTMPGQDAFGTVQEIVQILEADPKTDWSKVNLEALRQHLIDMNEVTLKAEAAPKHIDGGLEITITGNDRTLVAIQRMIPAWVETMNGHQGWGTKAEPHCRTVRFLRSPRSIRRKSSTSAGSALSVCL